MFPHLDSWVVAKFWKSAIRWLNEELKQDLPHRTRKCRTRFNLHWQFFTTISCMEIRWNCPSHGLTRNRCCRGPQRTGTARSRVMAWQNATERRNPWSKRRSSKAVSFWANTFRTGSQWLGCTRVAGQQHGSSVRFLFVYGRERSE